MSSKAWFSFYVGDYLADTQHFTTEEHGAYLLLLMHYWTNQGPITSNHSDLRLICKLSKHKFEKYFEKISQKFSLQNEKYFHPRMDKEIAKAIELSRVRAKAGAKGGQAKASANGEQLPPQPQPQPHKEHSVNKLTDADASEEEREQVKKWLWDTAKNKLKINGSLLGKKIREHGEHAVACAIEATVDKSPADATTFFIGLLNANPVTGAMPEWQRIPYDDQNLEPWAVKHGFRRALMGEDYKQYRAFLRSAVTLRKDKAA